MKWEEWTPVKIGSVSTAIAGVILGAFLFLDDRHAHAEEFQELKRYTVYSLKEVELDSAVSRLNIMYSIPLSERREWQTREVRRLELRVKVMQTKLGIEE